MGVIEDIISFFPSQDSLGIVNILQNWLYVGILYALIIILAYWGISQWINVGKYPNAVGIRKGVVDLSIMGQAKNIRGNVIERKAITDREIEILVRSKSVSDLNLESLVNEFRERVDTGKLFSYVMRVHSWDDAFRFGEKKEIEFVTSVPIENVWWEEHKREFTFWNPWHGGYAKTIWAYNLSEVEEDIIRPDNKLTDIYNLVLVPQSLDKKMVDPDSGIEISLNMEKIHSGNNFARLSMWIPVLVKTMEETDQNQNQIDTLRDMVAEKENDISTLQRRIESARVQEHNEALVGTKDKKKQVEKTSLVLLGVICFIMGGITGLLPEWIPSLKNSVHPIVFVLAGAVILGIVLTMKYEKKAPEQKVRGETDN